MIKALVDPIVYTIPESNLTREQVEDRLFALEQWSMRLASDPDRFRTSQWCVDTIWEEGLWPNERNLAPLLARLGVTTFSCQDIITSAQRIISHHPYLESDLGVEDILVDATRCSMDPPEILGRLDACLQPRLLDVLGVFAYYVAMTGARAGFASLWESNVAPDTLQSMLFVDAVQLAGRPVDVLGDSFALDMDFLIDPEEVEGNPDILRYWESDPERAVLASVEDSWGVSPRPVVIHPAFVDSIRDLRLNTRSGFLRAVFFKAALVATGLADKSRGAEPHHLDVRKGGPQRVRARDGAKAWRCQITPNCVGYQIHYWLCDDGHVEFASVVPHNCFDIPE